MTISKPMLAGEFLLRGGKNMGGIVIYRSRYTPGVKGSEVGWSIGERATWTNRKGKQFLVTIDSERMSHDEASSFVREVIFDDGSGRFAVDEDRLSPILKDTL